jgi:hypothetical protein
MALPNNLYVLPSDVFDYISVEGVQLRLDDHRLATGQVIQATAPAAQGATTISVTALQFPLLAGTVLEFDGAGAPAVVEVVLGATAMVGSTSLTVVALPAALPARAAASDSGVNLATVQRLVVACQEGTRRVNLYCQSRYDVSQMAANAQANGSVKAWARCLAGKWLASRAGNSPPKSILNDCEEAIDEMKRIQTGALSIEGIGTRTSGWPFFTNVTVDLRYTYAKVRVQPQISEGTPTQYGQFVDWNSLLVLEY